MAVTAKATATNSLIGERLIKLTMSVFASCARRIGSPQLLLSVFGDHLACDRARRCDVVQADSRLTTSGAATLNTFDAES